MSAPGRQTVSVAVIPARNEAERVGRTVEAVLRIPDMASVIVVANGCDDATADVARTAGARVVEQEESKGKAAAMELGADEAIRLHGAETADLDALILVFLDADLADTASSAVGMRDAVAGGETDLAIGLLPPAKEQGGGHGFVVNLARKGIEKRTGWVPEQPINGQRAMTARTFQTLRPFARGFGVEVGMTVDALQQGLRVTEVPTGFAHRVTGTSWRHQLHRARQYRDVRLALLRRPTRNRP